MELSEKDITHLENITEYCKNINIAIDELSIDYDNFYASTSKKAVLAFFVEQIGEEANHLSKDFRSNHPEMDWEAIINFRHHIVHAYTGIVPDVLWDTVQNDIPELYNFCTKLLKAPK